MLIGVPTQEIFKKRVWRHKDVFLPGPPSAGFRAGIGTLGLEFSSNSQLEHEIVSRDMASHAVLRKNPQKVSI